MLAALLSPLPVPMAIAIYFTIWWVALFAVLPFGVRSQSEEPDRALGTDPGAPVAPRLALKALITTGISAILFTALLIYLKNSG
jgi:predicted secreted protein